jgi:hypothetical protein
MKAIFLSFLFAMASSQTLAQIQSGTIGVVYFTKDKIIMAADSRGTTLNQSAAPDDTLCKIATPNGKMVFVASGGIGYKNQGATVDFIQSWSSVEEIRRAYGTASMLYNNNHNRNGETAIQWGNLISADFRSLLLWHPEAVAALAQKQNGVLTRALIGGLDDDGKPMLLTTTVSFQQGLLPAVSTETQQITDCGPQSYCATGEIDVEQEFVTLATKRAKIEAKSWKPPRNSKRGDYDILRTMRLVELTIKYHGENVGGPIDAVEMNKDGTVRWFAAKENCAKD